MISGPTIPGTRDAVWQLVQHRVERLETGLTLAIADLEVAPGVVIDGLCRDAASQPVAVLSAVASDGDPLVGQVLAARRFLREQAGGLARLLPDARIQFTGQARVMVVGLEISAALRDALQPLAADGVELFRLHSVRVGGELRWMVQAVSGPQVNGSGNGGGAQVTVPGGVRDPRLQELCSRFLRVAGRLDGGVAVRGDRFSRTVEYCGEVLAELVYRDGRALVAFAGQSGLELLTHEDALTAGDRLIRVFLAAAGMWNAEEDVSGDSDFLARRLAGACMAAGPSASSIAALQERIQASRLTPEEGAALAGVDIWTPDAAMGNPLGRSL